MLDTVFSLANEMGTIPKYPQTSRYLSGHLQIEISESFQEQTLGHAWSSHT